MDVKETTELLALISESHPGRFPVTKTTIKVWQDMMSDQDFVSVMGRAKRHITSNPHPPSISDLKVKRYPVIGD